MLFIEQQVEVNHEVKYSIAKNAPAKIVGNYNLTFKAKPG